MSCLLFLGIYSIPTNCNHNSNGNGGVLSAQDLSDTLMAESLDTFINRDCLNKRVCFLNCCGQRQFFEMLPTDPYFAAYEERCQKPHDLCTSLF